MSRRQGLPREFQQGATLPLVALLLTALLGMAALTIDVGLMQAARQQAQDTADAAALAGASAPALAEAAAVPVVAANSAGGMAFRGLRVTTDTAGAVTVQGYVNAPLAFAPAVGFAPRSVGGDAGTLSVFASATAAAGTVCTLPPGMPVAPFGLIGDDPDSADPAVQSVSALLAGNRTLLPGAYRPASEKVILKLNVWDSSGKLVQRGSFDPLLTSGRGATYFDAIRQTSDQTLFADQALSTPPLSYDNVSFTRQYVAARLSRSNTAYDHNYAAYDPWFSAGQSQTEDRVLLLPVVRQAVKDKSGSVTLIAFAAFFVDTPYPTSTAGNGIVQGRFLGLTIPGSAGGVCSNVGVAAPPHLTR